MQTSNLQQNTRGRPRDEAKYRETLNAAIELFTSQGYEATSMDDVARLAGVSKQTVYSHFGSKENLFGLAVSERCTQSGMNRDSVDLDAPPEVMLPELARRFLELVTSEGATRVYAVCTAKAESHPELGAQFFNHGPKQTVQVVAEYLDAQVGKGMLRIENIEFASWQFLSMLKAEAQLRVQFNLEPMDDERCEQYIDSCVAMFLRAYESNNQVSPAF